MCAARSHTKLGIVLREAVEDELNGPKLVNKLNHSIDKHRDRLQLTPDMLLGKTAPKEKAVPNWPATARISRPRSCRALAIAVGGRLITRIEDQLLFFRGRVDGLKSLASCGSDFSSVERRRSIFLTSSAGGSSSGLILRRPSSLRISRLFLMCSRVIWASVCR